jgi:hypothetical protein
MLSYSKTSALRELSGANDEKTAVPDYLEATVYNKAGKDKILFKLRFSERNKLLFKHGKGKLARKLERDKCKEK